MKIDFEISPGFFVYLIVNDIDGCQYVGMTGNMRKRIYAHLSQARVGKHNSYLHNAIRKRGSENFTMSILHECSSRKECESFEMHEIKTRGTKSYGYNATSGGDGVRDLRPEVMQRLKIEMSKVKSGVPLSEQHKKALSESLTGRVFSSEHRDRISKSKTGIKASEEAKMAMSARLTGISLSYSHKKSLSESHLGKKMREESKEKLRRWVIEKRGRRVLCADLGISFRTILDATEWLRLNVNPKATTSSIGAACRRQNPRAYGMHWEYIEVEK